MYLGSSFCRLGKYRSISICLALLTLVLVTPAKASEGDTTFISIFFQPNAKAVVMWILLISSVLMMTFIIELFIKVRSSKLAPPAVIALLRDAISSGNYQMAYEVCLANPCFLSKIMQAAFESIGMGKHSVEEAMNEAFAKQAVRLKSRNNYLSVIGVISPMIGLTGTVLGMMSAFSVLSQSGVGQMTQLSGAISAVLIATAAGLIVAIPAFAFFYFFKNAMTTSFADVHAEAKSLLRPIPFDQLLGYGIERKA